MYVPAPGHSEPLPEDLSTAYVCHDTEVWTESGFVCAADSYDLAALIAELLKDHASRTCLAI